VEPEVYCRKAGVSGPVGTGSSTSVGSVSLSGERICEEVVRDARSRLVAVVSSAMTTVGEESVMMWCRRSVSGPRVMGKGTGMGIIPRYMAPRMRMRRRSSPGMRGSTLSPGVPGRWAAATAISSHS